MKTKRKTMLALLAALAVGVSVAAFATVTSSMSDYMFNVYAATAEETDNSVVLAEGRNTIDLTAGVETSVVISSTNEGYYTFSYTGGFDFDTTQSVTVTVNDTAYTLSITERTFSVYLTSPSTATITLTTTADVSLIFDFSYGYVVLGTNTYSFDEVTSVSSKFDVSYTGYYTLTYVSGAGTVAIGSNSYTLNAEGDTKTVYLTDVDNLSVVVSSYEDSTDFSFKLSYAFIDFGENTFTSDDNGVHVINSVNPGNYIFELESGSGSIVVDGNTYVLGSEEIIIYLDNPVDYEINVIVPEGETLVFTLSYTIAYTEITVDETVTLSLTADTVSYAMITTWNDNPNYAVDSDDNIIYDDDGNPTYSTLPVAGYYTFTLVSELTTEEVVFAFGSDSYTLNSSVSSFTCYLSSPLATLISIVSNKDVTISITVGYSESNGDDNTSSGATLALGTQVVNATGEGEEYVFTSTDGGSYTINCTYENAFIMVETAYGAEQILWDYDDDWNYVYTPYTFTLSAGESVTFIMSTNDWSDDTYTVLISNAIIVGTQTVNASYFGEEYVFTSEEGGSYTLFCSDDNAYIMLEENYTYISTPYTFTLSAGESIVFLMATEGMDDDTYEVTITNAVVTGTQTVNADGEGIAYTFTSESGGTYTLSCTDDNAYLMVEGAYWSEEIEVPYTFTLSAGESITFLMATNDWNEDTYDVTITEVNS